MEVNKKLVMKIQPKVIDHLGINLYTNLHSVISELIANSWDACAHNVHITVPTEIPNTDSEIIVKDDGNGMTFEEINDNYLQVGRNRRKDEGVQIVCADRKVLGRKGIGKFSVFGVADAVSIRSIKNKHATEFVMDIGDIKNNVG